MRGLSRHIEVRSGSIAKEALRYSMPIQLLDQFLAILRHLVQQRFRKETRRLTQTRNFTGIPQRSFSSLRALIFFRRVVRVELLSQGGNHEAWDSLSPERSTGFGASKLLASRQGSRQIRCKNLSFQVKNWPLRMICSPRQPRYRNFFQPHRCGSKNTTAPRYALHKDSRRRYGCRDISHPAESVRSRLSIRCSYR